MNDTAASPVANPLPNHPTIHALMKVPEEQHDLVWLKQALQFAVRLELATIPPYLCALWSIKDVKSPVYALVRSIVVEEMLHMGQACNLLTTLGGTPVFNTSDTVPRYPGPLPGDVHPGLIVPLQGLSLSAIRDVFLQIELPENGPIRALSLKAGETYATIGQFYNAIAAAFAQLPPEAITGQRQLEITFDSTGEQTRAINTSADAAGAITMIEQQGEGTATSPDAPFPDNPLSNKPIEQVELAHYYKFAEVFHGRTFIQGTDGSWSYTGAPIAFPDTYPVAVVPPGGYPGVQTIEEFNAVYTRLLNALQNAWATGDANEVNNTAINLMFELTPMATAIMQTPLPEGTGNYAPDFRLVPLPVSS